MPQLTSIVSLKAETKEDIQFFLSQMERLKDEMEEHQKAFDQARLMSSKLYENSERMHRLNLEVTPEVAFRNARLMTHYLQEATHADESLAMLGMTLAALQESLTLYLADTYHIDPRQEWTLDFEQGVLKTSGRSKEPI